MNWRCAGCFVVANRSCQPPPVHQPSMRMKRKLPPTNRFSDEFHTHSRIGLLWTTSKNLAPLRSAMTPVLTHRFCGRGNNLGNLIDHLGENIFKDIDISDYDGYMFFDGIHVNEGDVLTVVAGTYTFIGNPHFSPLLDGQNFLGDVFLTNSAGIRLSNIVTVPEPSSIFLLLTATVPFIFRRKCPKK